MWHTGRAERMTNDMDMEIFLIRHAQTLGNIEHRYIGRTDEPLSNAGIASFCDLAYPAANRIIISPMRRCIQTAKILYPMVKPVLETDLMEYDFGDFEGKNYEELKDNADYRAWIASGGTMTPPKGESMIEFKRRCCDAFIKAIDQAFLDGLSSVAFIVHGGTIMTIFERFAVPSKPFYDWQTKNLGCWSAFTSKIRWFKQRELINVKKVMMGD